MQMTCTCAIEVRDVCFGHNGNPILEHITFSVEEGEYLGVIGPNGGGKTTLFRIILGLIEPDAGDVLLYGHPISQFKERYLIEYVPQRIALSDMYYPATVEEIVKSGRTPRIGRRRYGAKDLSAVSNAMENAGVSALKNRLIGSLSGGERQRVFIERAIASEPKLLILDEPEVGVNLNAQEQLYSFVDRLNSELGMTVLLISHDIDVVAHQAKTVLCLNRKLVCHGPPKKYITEEYMQRLYGKQVRFVLHGH